MHDWKQMLYDITEEQYVAKFAGKEYLLDDIMLVLKNEHDEVILAPLDDVEVAVWTKEEIEQAEEGAKELKKLLDQVSDE